MACSFRSPALQKVFLDVWAFYELCWGLDFQIQLELQLYEDLAVHLFIMGSLIVYPA